MTKYGTRFFSILIMVSLAVLSVSAQRAPKASKSKRSDRATTTTKKTGGSQGAAIVFPAKGVFNPDQGSVELILAPSYNFEDSLASGSGINTFNALHICGAKGSDKGGDGFTWRVNLGQWQANNYVSISSARFDLPIEYRPSINYMTGSLKQAGFKPFKAGDWRSMAATWQRDSTNYVIHLYFDGQLARKGNMPVSKFYGDAKVHDNDLLIIGHPRLVRGTLESYRVSNKVRTQAEITAMDKNGLTKDDATLLFVDAEAVSKMKTRNIDALINSSGRNISVTPEGVVFGKLELIPGPRGQVIDFPR